jgi:hypothetical protein
MTTVETINRLKQATASLLWVSESDYPFETIAWERGIDMTPTALFPELSAPDLPIETMITTDFFEPVLNIEDWYGDEELAIVDRYADLLQTIDANLSEVLVYRIGEIDVAIYIVGKTSDGDLVGLKTRSIET